MHFYQINKDIVIITVVIVIITIIISIIIHPSVHFLAVPSKQKT